jgi:MinD-like ATPase involved in chromosome partitioning or flagellar assembly
LGLEKPDGLNELLNTPAKEITRKSIEEKLIKLPEGIKILAASPRPKDAALLQNIQQFETIVNRMEFMARYVLIDLGCGLTALNQRLAPTFKELIVVVEPFENSLQHAQALLEDLINLGVDKDHLAVAVNYRLRSDTPQLSVMQIQAHITVPIDVAITPAPELFLQASRKHLVASLMTQESLTAQQFNSLAAKIEARTHKPVKI